MLFIELVQDGKSEWINDEEEKVKGQKWETCWVHRGSLRPARHTRGFSCGASDGNQDEDESEHIDKYRQTGEEPLPNIRSVLEEVSVGIIALWIKCQPKNLGHLRSRLNDIDLCMTLTEL